MAKLKPNQFRTSFGALITERPLLFQTEMVQANLDGRKSQTRRIVKNYPNGDHALDLGDLYKHNPEYFYEISPYGKPGDLLWVRETWQERSQKARNMGFDRFFFKAGWQYCTEGGWKPSIHMPKSASRIWLMVEDIRVERVQDISEEDAKAEGIFRWVETRMKSQPSHYRVYTDTDPEALYTSCPKDSFETLWISINGEDSWTSNPWVWVVKYRILSQTGRPSIDVIERNYLEVIRKEAVNA